MTYDDFKEQLSKLHQIRVDLPVVIYDPDMNERLEVVKVTRDLNGQVTIIVARR